MRSLLFVPLAAASLFASNAAFALPHDVAAFSHFNISSPPGADQEFKFPDLTPKAAGQWSTTMGGVTSGGNAKTDSDLGSLEANADWDIPSGVDVSKVRFAHPNEVHPVSRIEQRIRPAVAGTKVGAKIVLLFQVSTSFSAAMGTAQARAFLDIGTCGVQFAHVVQANGTTTDEKSPSGSVCQDTTWKATVEASSLTFELPDIGEGIEIRATVDGFFQNMSDVTKGSAAAKGTLTVQGIGGAIRGESPTFLGGSTSEPDGGSPGTPDASSSTPPGQDAAPPGLDVDAGNGAAPSSGSSDDGGCNTSGASASGAGLIGLVIAAFASRRRRRA